MAERAPAVFDPEEDIWGKCGAVKAMRRRITSAVYRIPDTGLFGFTPLRTHINICGYPRSGTTLLLMMMEYALPGSRHFGKEVPAWRAATFKWRNHAVMVSKHPLDVFRTHRLRNFYKTRSARLRVIVLIRDPRDVFTSHHFSTGSDRYFQDLDQWKDVHGCVDRYCRDPDVLLVRYEDLVADPDWVQARIDAFTGEPSERRFAHVHTQRRKDFDSRPLNGLRPVDSNGIGRWRRPEHRDRIRQVLDDIPQIPKILIELGYERDDRWVNQLTDAFTAAVA